MQYKNSPSPTSTQVVALVHKDDVQLWDGSVGDGWVLTVRSSVVLDESS